MSAPLGFVVCGAPLAARAPAVARALTADGHTLAVAVSEAATEWVNPDVVTAAGRDVAIISQRAVDQLPAGRPDRAVVFPLTFNTANKIAAGIMDTQVSGALCDVLAISAPILAVLTVSDRLWGHPAWSGTLDRLIGAGVRFLDPRSGDVVAPQPLRSGTGDRVAAAFDPAWVVDALAELS